MSDFNPLSLIENAVKAGFDPGAVSDLDERQMNWSKNIVSWIMDSEYLNIKTIFPTQLQVLLRLFGDVCPHCSDWEFYSKDFDNDITTENALDRLQILDDGVCPKCKTNKLEHFNDGFWSYPDELDLCWGMRCTSLLAWVYTKNGLVRFKDVNEGDTLTHGKATKKFYSGFLPSLQITTKYNWVMTGAKESHIVPILNEKLELEHKLMKDCKAGEVLVLYSPNMWPKERVQLGTFSREKIKHGHQAKDFNFPTEVTPELARLLGYLISDGHYTRKYNIRIMSSDSSIDEDIRRCSLAVFGMEPTLESVKECETTPFCKTWSISGIAVTEWLAWIGLEPLTAKDKYIPDCILRSSKEIVCEFLAGLFGGDVGVHAETMPNGRKKVLLHYTTASKTLMEQVRLILLNLGIVTRCSKLETAGFRKANKYIKDYGASNEQNTIYTLSTKSSDYVNIFAANVNLASQAKRSTLALTANIKSRLKYETPLGTFTQKTAPEKLKSLIAEGYFPVKIKDIRDGEVLEMMDVHIPDTNIYTADGFVHHNSGKSAISGMGGTYILHRFLRLSDPAGYFNQLKGQELYFRFVAMTLKQAKESNWMHFCRSAEGSDWFRQYHDFLNDHGKRKGVEIYKWLNEEFVYNHKGIKGYVTGASSDTSRGRTSIFAAIDEIGWWSLSADAKKANAHETYLAYEKSCRTLRNAAIKRFKNGDFLTPTACMFVVSSTMSKSDYILRLIKQGKLDPKKVISHKASWEVNPMFDEKELENEKKKDPKAFWRDYGSVPPYAKDPFINEEEMVTKQILLDRPTWNIKQDTNLVGSYLDAQNIERNKSIPYMLSVDMGRTDCGYALTLLKLKEDDFTVVQVAGTFAIYPESKTDVVDMDAMFQNFISVLCDKILIKMVVFDQWQSQTQIDALKKLGIMSQQYSLVYKDFMHWRTQLYQSKIEFCQPEMTLDEVDASPIPLDKILYSKPYLHLIWQILSVSESGTKINKGEGHDDIFRALVLGSHLMWDDKLRPHFEYKGGMAYSTVQRKGGGLVISGGSRSGHQYTTNSGTTSSTIVVGNRVLGSVITRGRR